MVVVVLTAMYKVIFAKMCKNSETGTSWRPIRDEQKRHLFIVHIQAFTHSHSLFNSCDSVVPSTSKRHKQKTLIWHKYTPCDKATWVPAKSIPDSVKKKISEGVVRPRQLRHVIMTKRIVVGPARAHEQLQKTNSIARLFSSPRRDADNSQPRPWQIVKYSCMDDDNAGSDNDPPRKRRRTDPDPCNENDYTVPATPADTTNENDYTVPEGIESKIDTMMISIKRSYDSLPADPSKQELEDAYDGLCQRKYFTGKLSNMYPFNRWKTCRKIQCATGLMKVRVTDRQAWSCRVCHPTRWHVDMAKTATNDANGSNSVFKYFCLSVFFVRACLWPPPTLFYTKHDGSDF